MLINVYLGNPFKTTYRWQSLCEEVLALLKPSINFKKHKLRVASTMTKPPLHPADVVVYMLPDRDYSQMGLLGYDRADPNDGGATRPAEPCASEVYLDGFEPKQAAKFIWHEIAHNKAKQGNSLHGGNGLLQSGIGPSTELKEGDIKKMKKWLPKHVSQWTEGF